MKTLPEYITLLHSYMHKMRQNVVFLRTLNFLAR